LRDGGAGDHLREHSGYHFRARPYSGHGFSAASALHHGPQADQSGAAGPDLDGAHLRFFRLVGGRAFFRAQCPLCQPGAGGQSAHPADLSGDHQLCQYQGGSAVSLSGVCPGSLFSGFCGHSPVAARSGGALLPGRTAGGLAGARNFRPSQCGGFLFFADVGRDLPHGGLPAAQVSSALRGGLFFRCHRSLRHHEPCQLAGIRRGDDHHVRT